MDISNNTIIPRSPEVRMVKTKYFGGPTVKTRFFSIFPFCTLCCIVFAEEETTSFCVSLLEGGNFS